MKQLTTYIKEELDVENLMWKIEMWFRKKPQEYKQFTDFVNKCKDVGTVSKEAVEKYLKGTNLKLKQFIDFLDDDIYNNDETQKDYVYLLKKTIENILSDKTVEM